MFKKLVIILIAISLIGIVGCKKDSAEVEDPGPTGPDTAINYGDPGAPNEIDGIKDPEADPLDDPKTGGDPEDPGVAVKVDPENPPVFAKQPKGEIKFKEAEEDDFWIRLFDNEGNNYACEFIFFSFITG